MLQALTNMNGLPSCPSVMPDAAMYCFRIIEPQVLKFHISALDERG